MKVVISNFCGGFIGRRPSDHELESSSGKYMDRLFVTALLECLKRNPDGTLSEFIAEIKAKELAYRTPQKPNPVSGPPTSAVSHTSFWKRRLDAFVPIQTGSTLSETVAFVLEDIKSVKLAVFYGCQYLLLLRGVGQPDTNWHRETICTRRRGSTRSGRQFQNEFRELPRWSLRDSAARMPQKRR